jgi:2-haloalkanoic acid dehalogenase type II
MANSPIHDRPALLTYDIFGTVLDWRRGMRDDLAAVGVTLSDADFDRVVDAHGHDEGGPFQPYARITADSLVKVLGVDRAAAERVGANVGRWPLYPDSADALRRIMRVAPCAAMTNSDREHGVQVRRHLGFELSDWVCAEDVRLYKPDPAFWKAVAARRGVTPGPAWWHVSAYADYDLATAKGLGLTTVFIDRPHARPAPADYRFSDLRGLADALETGSGPAQPR